MRRVFGAAVGIGGSVLLGAGLALASEGAKAPDYSGVSSMYYAVIAVILGYGIYDTFLKKS